MFGRNSVKRAVKRTAGWAASLETLLAGRRAPVGACVFYYHRVADVDFVDGTVDDWNVRPETFERQVAALSEFAEIVPLLELPDRLRRRTSEDRRGKPLVALTFDDGYASFHRHALPVLRRYGAHATAFVVTGTIGLAEPQPFDGWARKNLGRTRPEDWRAMNWEELEDCIASGLVHIGAHSHRHLRGSLCQPSQLEEEAARSREILRGRLGETQARAYAYPYGSTRLGDASAAYVEAVRAAGYETAVTTDLGLVTKEADPFLLPRIEAHALDAPRVLRAKAQGTLAPYRLTDNLRLLNRAL
ncbi:MAG TPA: polysaccharide deacetylase family protein [Pyrinomonadaceae bacterium]|nr:polysaccharide deacetylase family protein [Pyrinomonadaceae bacterium]